MMPNNCSPMMEQIQRQINRTLKELFKDDIKGSFLIEIKSRVVNAIGEKILNLYDFSFPKERIVTPGDSNSEYDICKHIVGVHRSNTIFLTAEEKSKKERDENYKAQLTQQVYEQIVLRRYGSAYFRHKAIVLGERFIYYPVPYLLFVLCIRMNDTISHKECKTQSAYYFAKIINKAVSALFLLEDNFLGTAYLPCRTVFELYAKLLVIRAFPELFKEDDKFTSFETIQSCCNQVFPDEFNKMFDNRKNQNERNKIEYLHYGFVDRIPNYHNIVKQKPYTFIGILNYLKATYETQVTDFERIEHFYKNCNVYVHGSILEARYPLLHYFEISLMLSCVIPTVYEMFCNDYSESTEIDGIDVLNSFKSNYTLLLTQYQNRSTENFEKNVCCSHPRI